MESGELKAKKETVLSMAEEGMDAKKIARLVKVNEKDVQKWINENLPKDIYVSVMAQYFPTYKAKNDSLINRKLNKKEYKEVLNYLYSLDLQNGYIQELGSHEEEYVPNFNLTF